jgi:hypothetical protein
VVRVCQLLNVTEYELSRLCAIPWGTMRVWREKNLFPSYVALQFKQLESWYVEQVTRRAKEPLVPVQIFNET